mgnify:CR=1 FL=1
MRCVICMSRLVPQVKVDGIRALGAEVRIVGRSQDEAQAEVDRLVAEDLLEVLLEDRGLDLSKVLIRLAIMPSDTVLLRLSD